MGFTYHWSELNELAKANVRGIPTATLDARHCDLVSSAMAQLIPWRPLITTIANGSIPLIDGVQDYSVPPNFMGLARDVRLTRTDLDPNVDINLDIRNTLATDDLPRSPYSLRAISHEEGVGQLRLESAVQIGDGETWEIRGEIRSNPTKITNTNQGCWFDDKYANVALAGLEYWLRKLAGDANAGSAVTDGTGRVNYTGQLGVFYAMLRDMQKAEDSSNGEMTIHPESGLAIGRLGGLPGAFSFGGFGGGGSVSTLTTVVPSGVIDGSNAMFTIPTTPIGAMSLYKNGVKLLQGTAYTLTGKNIQYLAGYIPQVGDTHEAVYNSN